MADLVTFGDVRTIIGIGDDIISDTDLTVLISEIQKQIISSLKVFITPTKVLEIRDGNNKNELMLNRPYVWKILQLKTTNDSIDPDNITIDPLSSIITIDNYQSPYLFSAYKNSVKIKYLSAFMEKTNTMTESSADVEAGTSVTIAVDDESDFTADDWVLIEGLDGKREAAKITSTGTNEIVVDLLVQDHEDESVITKLQTHELLRQLILYESAVAGGINSVGGSYSFATGYTFPEYSVQLGVPHPHFSKSVNDNIKKAKQVKSQLDAKLNVVA